MGIFFRSSRPVILAINEAIEDALRVDPATPGLDASVEASVRAVRLTQTVVQKFNWFSFVIALLISGALLWGAIWTAQNNLPDISKDLMNSFVGFSGIVLGLLGGEAQKFPSS
jgi:hypothetical protein